MKPKRVCGSRHCQFATAVPKRANCVLSVVRPAASLPLACRSNCKGPGKMHTVDHPPPPRMSPLPVQAVEDDDTYGESDSSENEHEDYDPEDSRRTLNASEHSPPQAEHNSDEEPQSAEYFHRSVSVHAGCVFAAAGGGYQRHGYANSTEIDYDPEDDGFRCILNPNPKP